MSTPDVEPVEVIDADVIRPRVAGRFALFDTPDGGLHIAYRPDGAEADEHFEVPGHIMAMAAAFSEGKLNPMQLFKMFGG